ncbi:MAG: AAA family ATPase [Tannerellaceae bacterium]|jgi:energy-coupling factor transporter ATP-binding protein EcfA2|nr:AAA family ATPase [Tannerellaceae bacterium]
MQQIAIKNFGPVKEGIVHINKATVLVGNQGSGKSTVAKLISTFIWIEKALVRGDYDKKWFESKNKLKNQYLAYHRIENYLYPDTEIQYQGSAYIIQYREGRMLITETSENTYPLPQIMYVPAERNFLSYIKDAKGFKLSSASLREYNTEYFNAKQAMKGAIRLPINDTDVEYNKQYDNLYLKIAQDKKIEISEASSGFQSFVPLYLVSDYLANSVKSRPDKKEAISSEEENRFKKGVQAIWANETLTDEQSRLVCKIYQNGIYQYCRRTGTKPFPYVSMENVAKFVGI